MNIEEAKIFAAELGGEVPELDLHGLRPSEAIEKLELFLYDCNRKGQEVARVIYGGGTGKLKECVLGNLENNVLVSRVVDKGGYCIVLLEI